MTLLPGIVPHLWRNWRASSSIIPTATITHNNTGVFTSYWQLPVGDELNFNWGDGSSPTTIIGLGIGVNVQVEYDYDSGPAPHTITITGDLTTVDYFNINNMSVTDISGLDTLVNVRYPYCHRNDIVDISVVASWSINTQLFFSACNIVDLSPILAHAPLYITAYFRNNQISDMSQIFSCENIVVLQVRENTTTYTTTTWPDWNGVEYDFSSTVSTPGEVGQMIIDASVGTVTGIHDCTFIIDGSCPAPPSTPEVNAAIAKLTVTNNVLLYTS